MSENERDRRIDTAWNAASAEEPPPALDAAIRAAARRAVDARPARKRDRTWRYPLAAAAVVALLAIGIVQLTPPERVAPTTVAEIEPAAGGASKDIAEPPQEAKQRAQSPAPASAPVPAVPAPPAQPHARAVAERAPSQPAARGAASRPETAKREVEALDKLARAEPATPAPPAAASAKTAPPISEPFPAAAPERAAAPRAAEQTPAIAAARQPAAAAAPEPAREGVARQRKALASDEASAPEERGVSSATSPRASLQGNATQVSAAKARATDARVEEWIKRIRDLKREGRVEEAAKELAAFRTAYGTRADALLPADLREPRDITTIPGENKGQ